MNRTLSWSPLTSILALIVTGCGGGSPASGSHGSCQDAIAHLNDCAASSCASNDSAACRSLLSSSAGSLEGDAPDQCASMAQADIDHVLSASCDDLLKEAGGALSGKADGPCPPYFSWCESTAGPETGYDVRVDGFDDTSVRLVVTIRDIAYKPVAEGGRAYHRLDLQGAALRGLEGRPAIPAIGLMVGAPAGTDKVWADGFQVLQRKDISGIVPLPQQPPTIEDAPAGDLIVDPASYKESNAVPGIDLSQPHLETWRNYRVARLEAYPLQYVAATQKLTVATKFTLTVHFANDQSEPVDTVDSGEESFTAAYDSALVNYNEVADSTDDAPAPDPTRVRYLIIVHDPLAAAVAPLVKLENERGYPTEVVKLSEVPHDEAKLADGVKALIHDRYAKSGIEYVLLVGDPDDLPMRKWEVPNAPWYVEPAPSDSWYACLEGDDPLPEVAVGRLPGKTPEQITTQVNKILAYAKEDPATATWRRNVLLVAHEQNYPKKYTACLESVRNAKYSSSVVHFDKLYGGEGATNEQVIAKINEGIGILNYRGHGSETAWAVWNGEDFNVAEAKLANQAHPTVVFSIACLNMAMQSDETTMAEQWMFNSDAGAVGFLGATRPSFTTVNHDFDRYLFQAVLNDGLVEAGGVLMRATALLYNQYGDDMQGLANMRMYAWLGDPALRVGAAFDVPPPEVINVGVIINEVLADPPLGDSGDANGDGTRSYRNDEFVEVVNTTAHAMDLSGWKLSDAIRTRFVFPDGTNLEPGKAVVVFGGGDASTFGDMGGSQVMVAEHALGLNNHGDVVTLLDATGTPVDRFVYKATIARQTSMVREKDSDPQSRFVKHQGTPPYSPGKKADGSLF